jgi:hypothetical protein
MEYLNLAMPEIQELGLRKATLLAYIRFRSNLRQGCSYSVAKMAKELNTSPDSIKRDRDELVAEGWITKSSNGLRKPLTLTPVHSAGSTKTRGTQHYVEPNIVQGAPRHSAESPTRSNRTKEEPTKLINLPGKSAKQDKKETHQDDISSGEAPSGMLKPYLHPKKGWIDLGPEIPAYI